MAYFAYEHAWAEAVRRPSDEAWRRVLAATKAREDARNLREQERQRARDVREAWEGRRLGQPVRRPVGAASSAADGKDRAIAVLGLASVEPSSSEVVSSLAHDYARARVLTAWSEALIAESRTLCTDILRLRERRSVA